MPFNTKKLIKYSNEMKHNFIQRFFFVDTSKVKRTDDSNIFIDYLWNWMNCKIQLIVYEMAIFLWIINLKGKINHSNRNDKRLSFFIKYIYNVFLISNFF